MNYSEHQSTTGVAGPSEYRPVQDVAPRQPSRHSPEGQPRPARTPSPRWGRKTWVYGFAALAAILVIGGGVWCYQLRHQPPFSENTNISRDQYQAVFLANGQVYFGHLGDLDHKFVTITDIFYLQVQQSQTLQQGTGGNTDSQVSLAKLGSELHGPQDKMYIAADQVLFWENLKPDSKVVQAIKQYKTQ